MRLSKKKRIKQHKKVYGKSFTVEFEHDDQPVILTVRVTKLARKGQNDAMHITITGNIPTRESMMTYSYHSLQHFGYVAWTKFGPIWRIKGYPLNHSIMGTEKVRNQIIKGCELILVESTILEDTDE